MGVKEHKILPPYSAQIVLSGRVSGESLCTGEVSSRVSGEHVSNDSPEWVRLLGKYHDGRIKIPLESRSNFNCIGRTPHFENSKHDPRMAR
jgi:hypothetical protein